VGQGFLIPRTIRWAVGLAVLGAVAVGACSRPLRYDVDGVSMAPGLAPGDRVMSGPFPLLDRLRRPERFDRWVLATADGEAAIKRVVGLPGEQVSIVAGDLAIDGTTVLKGPRLLAEVGTAVTAEPPAATGSWSMAPREVLDDVAIDAGRSVVLVPVRDVGFAAVVAVQDPTGNAVRAWATVGRTVVTWRLPTGRSAIVVGRLDGHVVAVAWRLHGVTTDRPGRSCLPPGPPDRWSAAMPWAEADPATDRSPPLALTIEPAGGATSAIERVDLWRDVFHRPAADGVTEWTLAADAVFTLGDHPAASRDSRHWGPVSLAALRHRVAAVVFADR
jgi:type IV secretory pathway protease TraF